MRPKLKRPVPFDFVLDNLISREPRVKAMFGCFAVYCDNQIVFLLRDQKSSAQDNGVWIATTAEHHESLKKELPSMRSISAVGPRKSGWQVIPASADGFESSVMCACELVVRHDPRIGKIPRIRKNRLPKNSKKGNPYG